MLVVEERNSRSVWERLWSDTEADRATLEEAAAAVETASQAVSSGSRSGDAPVGEGLGARMLSIAREGHWDARTYRSPSEARMAVIVAAARSGFALVEVQQRMLSGAWPGLAGLYAKYTPQHRQKTLAKEWNKALTLIAATPSTAGDQSVRRSDTSMAKSQGGPPLRDFMRAWRAARMRFETGLQAGRSGLALRMVLRAVDEAAAKTGDLQIAFGVRALALATGMHASTVAEHLHTLASMPGALIVRTQRGRGLEADTWSLIAPASEGTYHRRRHKVYAVRPAFRELGHPEAFVYEELEHAEGPLAAAELASLAKLGRSTVHEALETLGSWGLATSTAEGWVLGCASLTHVAELLGADVAAATQHTAHQAQRRNWRAWLTSHTTADPIHHEELYPYWLWDPGPDIGDDPTESATSNHDDGTET